LATGEHSPHWSSCTAFFLAATGCVLGLGDVWNYADLQGQHGGSAFLLVYLVSLVLLALPIMIAELAIGRRGGLNPIHTFQHLTQEAEASVLWKGAGWIAVATAFLVLCYYSVIAGWLVAYGFRSAIGSFRILTPDGARYIFQQFVSDPEKLLAWHSVIIAMTVGVSVGGPRRGLETFMKWAVPGMALLLLALIAYAVAVGDVVGAIGWLFSFKVGAISRSMVLEALGQAFYTVSIGLGVLLIYGAYLRHDAPLGRVTGLVVLVDVLFSVLVAIVVTAVIFAQKGEVTSGPALVFQNLPVAFGHLPYGALFGTLFFVLLLLAAWTSAVALMEPVVSWLTATFRFQRATAAVAAGGAAWTVGLLPVISFGSWSFEFRFLGERRANGFFDVLDIVTADILLPVSAIVMSLFVGWAMKTEQVRGELNAPATVFYVWWLLVRFVSPLLVAVVLIRLLFGRYLTG
jgi:NSS family neurotransmitter:Na+ symporter